MSARAISAPRRGLRRTDAAIYIGVSPTKFDDMVKAGRILPGFMLDGCRVWDVHDLDAAFDRLKAEATGERAPRGRVRKVEIFDRM